MPNAVLIVTGVVLSAFNCAKVRVVPATVSESTPKAGEASSKLPVTVSPVPTALVPLGFKSDSKTLLSVPATVPSFKPIMDETPTMVMVSVVVAVSPSPSAMP